MACNLLVEELKYLVIFGPLGQVKGGIDFRCALLAEGRQLERYRLSQTVARLQLQLGWLSWDLVEVSGHMPKIAIKLAN